MKKHILSLLILLNIGILNAQNEDLTPPTHKFNLSVLFPGASIMGPKYDIEEGMKSAGLESTGPNVLGGSIDYPITKKGIIYDLEASYFFGNKSAIALNAALIDDIEVTGKSFETMSLESNIWSMAINYLYCTQNKRHYFFVGPAYFFQTVNVYFYSDKYYDNTYHKPGFYLGYSYQIIQKKRWFLMLKTNYRWAPKVEIGPYDYQFAPETQLLHFPSTKVSLACLNIGVSVGIRFGKK